jgi:D-arabinose 5-phosphate isomerase GutQ
MIGSLGEADGALGVAADIALTFPTVSKVCPMELAPTTSSTMNAHVRPVRRPFVLDKQQVVSIANIHNCLRAGIL